MDIFIFFILGTLFGSFYNVVAFSLLDKGQENLKHILLGRSHCPNCKEKLSVIEMIPIVSYILLLGKCKNCKQSISCYYLLGELITSVTFALLYHNFGFSIDLLIHLTLGSLLVISVITDIKKRLILNKLLIVFGAIILILRIVLHIALDFYLLYYLVSGFVMFLSLFLVMVLSGNKLGGGDVKLYGVIALTIGALDAFYSLFFASVLGLLIMIPGMLLGKVDRKTQIPFVPFIWIGVLLTYYIDVSAYLL
ncbi:prepilin peptidase [Natranaerobius trueperi]|nr:A24 family peptidase [Natranaerobius trueperi]